MLRAHRSLQFSAAVADTIATTGNMEDITHRLMKAQWGTVLVGVTVSKSFIQRLGMLAIALVLGFITIFAVPAS
jgi:hypothetical protein